MPVWFRVPLVDASAQLIDAQLRHGMMARLVKRKLCAAEVLRPRDNGKVFIVAKAYYYAHPR